MEPSTVQLHNQDTGLPNLKSGEFITYPLSMDTGFLLGKLPDNFVKELEDKKKQDPYNNELVGHLEHEYTVTFSDELSKYILMKAYDLEQQLHMAQRLLKGVVDIDKLPEPRIWQAWVNYQKKHEFNPPHIHTGLYSFVIWHKIPYKLDEELQVFPKLSKDRNKTSQFAFIRNNVEIILPLDQCHENYMAVFPADLMHYVNPFYTSDDYRISFSGNISFES